MLNVQTTDRMMAGTSVGLSSGSVMLQNCWRRVAPSTVAASYMSAEIDCRPPRITTIMNGNDNQPLVASPVMNELNTPSNQATGSPPNIWMPWLMAPNCWWNNAFQISAVM